MPRPLLSVYRSIFVPSAVWPNSDLLTLAGMGEPPFVCGSAAVRGTSAPRPATTAAPIQPLFMEKLLGDGVPTGAVARSAVGRHHAVARRGSQMDGAIG